MKLDLKLLCLFLLSFFLINPLFAQVEAPPLTNSELQEFIPGNTLKGTFSDTHKEFALYFAQTHEVFIQKDRTKPFTSFGSWSIENNLLVTPWPYEDLKISKDKKFYFFMRRNLTVYKLEFRPISENLFEPFRPQTCGCESFSPQAFPNCSWTKGRSFL